MQFCYETNVATYTVTMIVTVLHSLVMIELSGHVNKNRV